jgi:type II secretory ATPase GspE/PulE/Tfp pilus assembly ATPase PilB-like protein
MSLGKILQDSYGFSDNELQKALKLQQEVGGPIGKILLQMGTITEGQWVDALSRQLGLPIFEETIEIEDTIVTALREKVSYDYLLKHLVFPLRIDHKNGAIFAVTNDPFNYSICDYLVNTTGYGVNLYLAPEQIIRDLFKNNVFEQRSDIISLDIESDAEKLKEMAFDAPVIKYLNNIITQAVELRASDIHIESSEKQFRVRFRIDGILNDMDILEGQFYWALVSRIKLLASLDIAEKRLPQDGKFTTKIASAILDIRVSTMPMVSGEGVVLRLLFREKILLDLEHLGPEADHREIINHLITQTYGILLVTGPTGSGKTTSLYTMLSQLNSKERKIITIEDPVEYQLARINQIQVKSEIGFTFAHALRSILRHDPDIIMVGEIRDKETAAISIQSSLTGHLVLSTLHTNDAPSALFRLVEMGVEAYLINASIIGLMAQRIIRMNCPHCSRPVQPSRYLLEEYDFPRIVEKFRHLIDGEIRILKGEGCSQCAGTGYRGRIGIFEVFVFTDDLKENFLNNMSLESIRLALQEKKGYRNMRADGMIKVAKGMTTIEEVLRVT